MRDESYFLCEGMFLGVILSVIIFGFTVPYDRIVDLDNFTCIESQPTLIGEYHKDGTFEVLEQSQKCTQWQLVWNSSEYKEAFE